MERRDAAFVLTMKNAAIHGTADSHAGIGSLLMMPQFNLMVGKASNQIADHIGLDRNYAAYGYRLFRFRG